MHALNVPVAPVSDDTSPAWGHSVDDAFPSESPAILIVEDDDGNRLLLQRVLEASGYRAFGTDNGPSALQLASQHDIAVVVLDLGLPGMDGINVLTALRRSGSVPVLVLSGRSDEQDRIIGLDAGADDYLVKPYSIGELSARVRALLRRGQPLVPRERLDIGSLTLDLEGHRAAVHDTPIDLTHKEFTLLQFLVEHRPLTFTRDDLLQHVWGSLAHWQDPATVTEHVRRVRMKLASANCTDVKIETVRGVGYRAQQPS